MPLHDSSAAQQARRSLADNVALGRRQDEGSNLETLVFTTTVALQMVVPSAVSIDGTSSNFQTIVPVTEVITSSVLVSPMTTSAVSASPSSTASSSTASSIPTTSSASTLPSSANLQTTPTTSGGFSALPSQSGNVIAAAGGAPTASSSSVPSDSRPFPTGAIAALVIAGFMFVNILCVYLYRRHSLAKRNRRRATWKAGIRASSSDFLNVEKGGSSEPRPPMPIPFTLGMPGTNGRSPSNGSMRSSVYNLPSALERTFPRDSFSPSRSISDARRASPPARPARSMRRPTGDGSPPMPSSDPTPRVSAAMSTSSTRVPTAIVRVTFIPTRTDELSISIGQTLAVLHTFDDGWALCANESGERGMVPLECLEGGGGQFAGYRDRSAMMQSSSRRASSLYPGSPATR